MSKNQKAGGGTAAAKNTGQDQGSQDQGNQEQGGQDQGGQGQGNQEGQEVEGQIKVRVLSDCEHGRCGSVVPLPASVVKGYLEHGIVDDHPDAVAYAESQQ
jgi:hypothetical protein